MFAKSLESERERWVQSVERRGFHCERGMKIETFMFTHPIRAIIQDQNLQFVGEEVKGYLPSIVKEFYSNLRENLNVDTLLETTISRKQLMVSPDSIARSLDMFALPHMIDLIYSGLLQSLMLIFLQILCAPTWYPWGALCTRSSS